MAESISEGTLSQLLIKVGDRVGADEEIASIETDKIDVTVNAPEDGVVTEIFVQEGDVVVVGEDLAQFNTNVDFQGQETQEPKGDGVKAAEKKPQPADASEQPPKDTPTSEGQQGFTTTPDRSVGASATDAVKPKASPPPEPKHAPVSAPSEVTPRSTSRNEHTVRSFVPFSNPPMQPKTSWRPS
jgi:2-oxoglutarate dehydrogenase E2 component (dihydrolipoamide succinyltransferase)